METYFIKQEDVLKFYAHLAQDYALYLPVQTASLSKTKCEYGFNLANAEYALKYYPTIKNQEIVFNEYRTQEPARSFFTYVKEEICSYFRNTQVNNTGKPIAICGFKNCDLFSLKIQDFVFLGGNAADPLYAKRREETLIISGDCSNFKEVCFCKAFDINPYTEEGFDFNFSLFDDGYLVDVASEKARKILSAVKFLFKEADSHQLSRRILKRQALVKRLEEHLSVHKIPPRQDLRQIVVSGFNSRVFYEQALTCVECGGCVFMCDTCHCFLLSDKKRETDNQRLRIWDGCLYKNFSRVAGGANPLKLRYMRLRNRYLKKFDFFVENIGYQACCGCGRCIEVCPGKIDIRYILRKLYEEKYLSTV